MNRLHVVTDPELGTVAAAVDEHGQILATAADVYEHGVYTVMDEAKVHELTGELMWLPPHLWEAATDTDKRSIADNPEG